MSEYVNAVKQMALDVMRGQLPGWSEQDMADAADELLGRGLGGPGLGLTGRVVANTLRKVKPIASFREAETVAGLLNEANYALTHSDQFDAEPYRCTHCEQRFRMGVSPKTHHTAHRTVLDPRTF